MPKQELFLIHKDAHRKVEVLKTYDQAYARSAFGEMDEPAQKHLWTSLGIEENFDPTDVPAPGDPGLEDFLWDELLDAAREDGNLLSFFVVVESSGNSSRSVYVSPDWPSAETLAKSLIANPK